MSFPEVKQLKKRMRKKETNHSFLHAAINKDSSDSYGHFSLEQCLILQNIAKEQPYVMGPKEMDAMMTTESIFVEGST